MINLQSNKIKTDKIEIALISLLKQRIEMYTTGIFSMVLSMCALSRSFEKCNDTISQYLHLFVHLFKITHDQLVILLNKL